MKVTKNVENSLPIEILQKGFIISEEEIKNNPVLKLTVNKYNFLTKNILYRKQKEIFSQIKLIQ
jgi:hypothetical protein